MTPAQELLDMSRRSAHVPEINFDQDPASVGPLAIAPRPRPHTGTSVGGSSARSSSVGSISGAPGAGVITQAFDKRTHFLCLKCKLPFLLNFMSKAEAEC